MHPYQGLKTVFDRANSTAWQRDVLPCETVSNSNVCTSDVARLPSLVASSRSCTAASTRSEVAGGRAQVAALRERLASGGEAGPLDRGDLSAGVPAPTSGYCCDAVAPALDCSAHGKGSGLMLKRSREETSGGPPVPLQLAITAGPSQGLVFTAEEGSTEVRAP